ncbi:MAG: class I adenylate-forming enzyme family protein [Gammaproteobacteria bacterium]
MTIDESIFTEHGLLPPQRRVPIPGGPHNVGEVLDDALSRTPDALALVSRHARLTYRELEAEVNAAVAMLREAGLAPGDRIAATLGNHAEIVVGFLAAQRLGAIWIGINRALAAPEKRYILQDAGARFVIADAEMATQLESVRAELPALREIILAQPGDAGCPWAQRLAAHRGAARHVVPVDPFAPAAIAYTSGTTGFPKGAVHSQHNMLLIGAARRDQTWRLPPVQGVSLPMTILNLIILGPLSSFQIGGTCVCMDATHALGIADWIEREGVQACTLVPTVLHDFNTNPQIRPERVRSLVQAGSGSAALPDTARTAFRDRFGLNVSFTYGLTEAPTIVTVTDPSKPFVAGGSGIAATHLAVRILGPQDRELPVGEVGEICVGPVQAGPWAHVYTPFLGYWNKPEATAAALRNGWLHTGDLGAVDPGGNLFVRDRVKDLIVRGGANVYPAEIERVVLGDARVAACAVVGKPDLRLGEIVVAFVQPAPGIAAGAELQAGLRALCERELARYKIPAEWIFVDDMPRNQMAKIVKPRLRERLGGT